MAKQKFERLTAQDLQFLMMETTSVPMDVVSTQVYRNGPLMDASGAVDIEAYRSFISSILHKIPRYRQKLKWIPYADIPVWVDDPNFAIDYHVRHTALPQPGTAEQLKRLTARIMERRLDRERPLWELWLVEGLENQRYAIISKIHQCIIEGREGLSLSHVLMSEKEHQQLPDVRPYRPGKSPSEVSLLWDEWNRRYSQPIDALRNAGELLRRPKEGIGEIERRVGAVRNSLSSMIRRPADTPINGTLSSHRRVDWLQMPLQTLKDAHHQLGCSLNDVVLGLLAGGIGKLFAEREFELRRAGFNVAVPTLTGEGSGGGVTSWDLPLPVTEPDTIERIKMVARASARRKREQQRGVASLLVDMDAWVPSGLLALFTMGKQGNVNTFMTNVVGASQPLYSMGAEMESLYSHMPLLQNMGLGTALTSYNGQVYWGINGDYDLIPDLGIIAEGISESYRELIAELDIDPGAGVRKVSRGQRSKRIAASKAQAKAKSARKGAAVKAQSKRKSGSA